MAGIVKAEIVLKSGKKLTVYAGKAKDLVRAQQIASSIAETAMALFSLLVDIDGKKLTVEEWEDMPLEDFMEASAKISPFFGMSETQPK